MRARWFTALSVVAGLCGLLVGHAFVISLSANAITATWDCASCPADTYDTTALAACDSGAVVHADAPLTVTAPAGSVTHTWTTLVGTNCRAFVTAKGKTSGKVWAGEPLLLTGVPAPPATTPAPTPTSTPTPTPAPVPQNQLAITSPVAGAVLSGVVPVVVTVPLGPTSGMVARLRNNAGVIVVSSPIKTAPGDVSSLTVLLDVSTVPAGSYSLEAAFSTMESPGIAVTVGTSAPAPPPTSPPVVTQAVDLTPVLQAVSQQGSLTTAAIQAVANGLAGNFQQMTAQLNAIAVVLTTPAPAPCVLTSTPTRYAVNAAGKRDYGFSCRLPEDEAIRLGLSSIAKGQAIKVAGK